MEYEMKMEYEIYYMLVFFKGGVYFFKIDQIMKFGLFLDL